MQFVRGSSATFGSNMELMIRETQPGDIEDMFSVRARTRQNSISKERLAAYGVTSESSAANMASGNVKGWACFDGSRLVGFCNGDRTTSEVLVLAVLPEYEGMGIGKRLLSHVVKWLCSVSSAQPWLAASPDPTIRAHGFYRSLGWSHNGKVLDNGDEILQLQPNNALQATCEDARA
jgi:GNAT superfamily N-acetyltransferase